jgi:hypothetical protein
MLLRVCVAVFLTTGAQSVLADPTSAFESALKAHQERFPSSCRINSPAMKVIYACSKIQGPNANPRFQSTIDAGTRRSPGTSSNGVNFCYNSLVEVQRNGDRLSVNVTRDSGQSAKMANYLVNLSNLQKDAGDYVLPITDFKGHCFGYTQTVGSLCGFGTDVPMALRLSVDEPRGPQFSVTAEEQAIKQFSANGDRLMNLKNKDEVAEAKKAAITYARKQLLAFAKQNMQTPEPKKTDPFQIESYRQCDGMLSKFEQTVVPAIPADPGDDMVLTEFRRRINKATPAIDPIKTGR